MVSLSPAKSKQVDEKSSQVTRKRQEIATIQTQELLKYLPIQAPPLFSGLLLWPNR